MLCFHGPLIYEAKALRSQVFKDKQVKYFIHYAGWNKKWVGIRPWLSRNCNYLQFSVGTNGFPKIVCSSTTRPMCKNRRKFRNCTPADLRKIRKVWLEQLVMLHYLHKHALKIPYRHDMVLGVAGIGFNHTCFFLCPQSKAWTDSSKLIVFFFSQFDSPRSYSKGQEIRWSQLEWQGKRFEGIDSF